MCARLVAMRFRSCFGIAASVVACGLFPSLDGLGDGGSPDATRDTTGGDTSGGDATDDTTKACPSIQRVQTQSSTPNNHVSSAAVTLNVTANNLLVAIVGSQYAGTLSVADSALNVWTSLQEQNNSDCVDDASPYITRSRIWYATASAAAPSDVITLTTSTSDYLTLTVVEYASSGTLSFETSARAIAKTSTAAASGGNIALTGCNNVVVCMFADENPGAGSWGLSPGFASLASATSWSFVAADDLNVDAGMLDPSATIPGGGDECWAVSVAAFAAS